MNRLVSTKRAYVPPDVGGRKTEGSRWMLAVTFVTPAALVVGLLFLLITHQGGKNFVCPDGILDLYLEQPPGL